MSRLRWVSLVVAVALGLPAAVIGEGPAGAPTVLFSPGMQEALDTTYGGSEGAVLRQTIREGVGAAFTTRLLDLAGQALKSLRYDWYAQDVRHGSRAAEPWATWSSRARGSVRNLRAPAARSRTRTRRLSEPASPLARGAPLAYVFMRPGARPSSIVSAKR